jgi:hypothetical protein
MSIDKNSISKSKNESKSVNKNEELFLPQIMKKNISCLLLDKSNSNNYIILGKEKKINLKSSFLYSDDDLKENNDNIINFPDFFKVKMNQITNKKYRKQDSKNESLSLINKTNIKTKQSCISIFNNDIKRIDEINQKFKYLK